MGQLSSIYTDVESSLSEVQELLNEEQTNEKLFHQGQQGSKRPPSMILKELSLEAGRYADAHAKAAESNMLLHKAINSHLGNLRTLSLPLSEIQTQLPSLQVRRQCLNRVFDSDVHWLFCFCRSPVRIKLRSKNYSACWTRWKRCVNNGVCFTVNSEKPFKPTTSRSWLHIK